MMLAGSVDSVYGDSMVKIMDRMHEIGERIDFGGIFVGILLVGFMVFLMIATVL